MGLRKLTDEFTISNPPTVRHRVLEHAHIRRFKGGCALRDAFHCQTNNHARIGAQARQSTF
jgi:hypothetical protein